MVMQNNPDYHKMQTQIDKNTDLLVDVGVLKEQVKTLATLCNKMDVVIEKLMEQNERNIERIYDDMESRKKETDADYKEVHERIDAVLERVEDSERRITDIVRGEINALRKDLLTQKEEPIGITAKFKEWKYMALGGLLVLGWLLEHLNYDTIKTIFGLK